MTDERPLSHYDVFLVDTPRQRIVRVRMNVYLESRLCLSIRFNPDGMNSISVRRILGGVC